MLEHKKYAIQHSYYLLFKKDFLLYFLLYKVLT